MKIANKSKDYVNYREYSLKNRIKLSYDWIPKKSETLLDVGCAWGYGTRFFKKKCTVVYGIDPNDEFINIAQKRYPHIRFLKYGAEKTPFKNNFFDVIVLNDVIEHVKDEIIALNELYRILKKNGTLIITTLHKGLFSFMDPDNYTFLTRTKISGLYRTVYKIIKGECPKKPRPGYEDKHRHYSLKNLTNVLNKSKFNEHFKLVKILRSGLFIRVFISNLRLISTAVLGKKSTSNLFSHLSFLSEIDYWIPCNILSYHLAIKIIKK